MLNTFLCLKNTASSLLTHLYCVFVICSRFTYHSKCNFLFIFLVFWSSDHCIGLDTFFQSCCTAQNWWNQELWAQALKKPTDIQGVFIELLISIHVSSLVLFLITNNKWTRSIPPKKWSEAHFERGILSKTLVVSLFRDPSWAGTTWEGGRRTENLPQDKATQPWTQIEGFDYTNLVILNVLIFMAFQLHIAWLLSPITMNYSVFICHVLNWVCVP